MSFAAFFLSSFAALSPFAEGSGTYGVLLNHAAGTIWVETVNGELGEMLLCGDGKAGGGVINELGGGYTGKSERVGKGGRPGRKEGGFGYDERREKSISLSHNDDIVNVQRFLTSKANLSLMVWGDIMIPA